MNEIIPMIDTKFRILSNRENRTILDGKFKSAKAVNAQFKVFFLGLGTTEPHSFPGVVKVYRQMMDKQGIKYTYYESPDTAHEWLTWRRALNGFAQLLFK